MPETCKPISDFYPLIRAMMLDKQDENGVWEFSDEQLQMAIASVICSGLMPECVEINSEMDCISPGNMPKQTIGLISLNVALNFLANRPTESYRTRAISHTVTPQAVQISIRRFEELIDNLHRKGGFCGEDTSNQCDVIYSIGDAATATSLSIGDLCNC